MQTRQQNKKWNITKEKQRTPNSGLEQLILQNTYFIDVF